MASQDLHSDIKTEIGFKLQVVDTDEYWVGKVIDTQNYESIEFVWASGDITDGVFRISFQHGDEAEGAAILDETAVSDEWIVGNATKVLDNTMSNSTNRYGYVGKKRYVKCEIKPDAGITTGGIMGIVMEKSNPRNAPVPEEHV